MFSTVLFFVLVVISGFFTIMWKKTPKTSEDKRDFFCLFSIVFILATVTTVLSLTFVRYSSQIADFSEVRGLKMKIALMEERKGNLTSIIKEELKKYPEIEENIIGKIGSSALLFLGNYPELQSNKTITKTVDDTVKIEDDVYKVRGLMIEKLKEIYLREISPWTIYVRSYEGFFGEKNPILLEKH